MIVFAVIIVKRLLRAQRWRSWRWRRGYEARWYVALRPRLSVRVAVGREPAWLRRGEGGLSRRWRTGSRAHTGCGAHGKAGLGGRRRDGAGHAPMGTWVVAKLLRVRLLLLLLLRHAKRLRHVGLCGWRGAGNLVLSREVGLRIRGSLRRE